jgi:hypothetical protein
MADLIFIHRFSRTVWCTVRIKEDPPAPGETVVWDFEWTSRPKPKHIAQYRQWVLSTTAILAQRWKQ